MPKQEALASVLIISWLNKGTKMLRIRAVEVRRKGLRLAED